MSDMPQSPDGPQAGVYLNAVMPRGPVTGQTRELPSPWLYLGGLVVTLSGLYAVNFGLENPAFATLTYGSAITGYLFSYVLRARGVTLQSLRAPLMVLLALIAVAIVSSDEVSGLLMPSGAQDDRFKSLQLVFVWISIIHSFALGSDASVLFACVPCMTMLALVSTRSSDIGIQNAFLAFVGAGTFLMIHENFLRTRSARLQGRTVGTQGRFFGGQLQITAFCLVTSLAMANLVAVPIQTVGQTLFQSGLLGPQDGRLIRTAVGANQVKVSEQRTVSLATGPVANNELEILKIRCARPLYWRGATYTIYTGTGFTNDVTEDTVLDPTSPTLQPPLDPDLRDQYDPSNNPLIVKLKPPQSPYELPLSQMRGATRVDQDVQVVGGLVQQYYGAGEIEEVLTDQREVRSNPVGGLSVNQPFDHNMHYLVRSIVPTEDEALLRAAPSGLNEVPQAIRDTCLQVLVNGQEDVRLRDVAREVTRGLTNNFDRATAIKQFVSHQCAYNLNVVTPPLDRDLVHYFLFDSRQGYCNSFAAAMTLLCRYAGIPARVVSGFLPGETGFKDTYTVKVKDKHDWTEVFLPHIGWVTFDATEGARVIDGTAGAKRRATVSFLAWFFSHGPLPPLTGIAVLSLIGYLIRTELTSRLNRRRGGSRGGFERPATNLAVIQLYSEACSALARRGLVRSPNETADEFVKRVEESAAQEGLTTAELLRQMTDAYTHFRFGLVIASEADVRSAQDLLGKIKTDCSRGRRRDVRKEAATAV